MPSSAFDEIIPPHLDAAFNYARWLTGNDADAEDVVQDACVPALRFFGSRRDGDLRAWLFTIVRNTWYSRVARRGRAPDAAALEDGAGDPLDAALDPEALLLQQQSVARVRTALEQLPLEFREAIVLREIEGLSYKEIAAVMQIPIGTVMSRLARGRDRLASALRPAPALAGRVR